MKVNLDTTSIRAREILATPQYKKEELAGDFEVSLDKSDKILTVFHSAKAGEIELIFNEALAVFAKNRAINDLWKINFREIENFLRDENHLPAFLEDNQILEDILKNQKIGLIAEAHKSSAGEEFITLKEMLFDWGNLSLVAKNQWASELLRLTKMELIFCDHETLTFSKTQKDVLPADLEIMIQKILGGGEYVLPMKVVAVQ